MRTNKKVPESPIGVRRFFTLIIEGLPMYGLLDPSDTLIQRLAWVLIHFLWQGTLVVTLLMLTTWMGRIRQAAVRYMFELIALASMVALPLATFCMLPEPSARPREIDKWQSTATSTFVPAPLMVEREVKPDESSLAESAATAVADGFTENILAGSSIPNGVTPEPLDEVSESGPSIEGNELVTQQRWNQTSAWIVSGWMLGVGLLSLRLLLGWVGASRIRRRVIGVPIWLEQRVTELAAGMRVPCPIIHLSQRVTEAVAVGILKPMILIPVAWITELSPDMIEDVVAHELAHIGRRDLWVNLLQRLVETQFFYHPAVWWLSRRLRIDREHCCDALVVRTLRNPLRYAETLEHIGRLSIARPCREFRGLHGAESLAVSIGSSRNILLQRIRLILAPPRNDGTTIASLAGLIPLVLACLAGWSLANRPSLQLDNEHAIVPPGEVVVGDNCLGIAGRRNITAD